MVEWWGSRPFTVEVGDSCGGVNGKGEPMNLQEAKSFLEQNDVRYVLAQFVNIHGVSKT